MAEVNLTAAFSTVPGGDAEAIKRLLVETVEQIARDDGTFQQAKLVFTESDERCGLTAELDGVKKEGVPLAIDLDTLEDAQTSAGARAQLKEAHPALLPEGAGEVTDDGVLLLYLYGGCVFRVPDGVQPPKAGSLFFCRHLAVRPGERVLEIGGGPRPGRGAGGARRAPAWWRPTSSRPPSRPCAPTRPQRRRRSTRAWATATRRSPASASTSSAPTRRRCRRRPARAARRRGRRRQRRPRRLGAARPAHRGRPRAPGAGRPPRVHDLRVPRAQDRLRQAGGGGLHAAGRRHRDAVVPAHRLRAARPPARARRRGDDPGGDAARRWSGSSSRDGWRERG